jgi:predicted nuclease with TOPRIM domain
LEQWLSALRCDHNSLLGRLAEVTGKWQATVAQNQQLHQHNGNLQAQLADAQQQLAMLQRECSQYRQLMQQQGH